MQMRRTICWLNPCHKNWNPCSGGGLLVTRFHFFFLACFTWYATPTLTAACAESTGGSSSTVTKRSSWSSGPARLCQT